MSLREGELQDRIRLALNHPRALMFRNNVGAYKLPTGGWLRYGVGGPGGSDLVGILDGRPAFIEIKTPTGRLSADQERFGRLVESRGGRYVVLRSVDDATALIAGLDP